MKQSLRTQPQLAFVILAAATLACNTLLPQPTATPRPTPAPTDTSVPPEPTATAVVLPTLPPEQPTAESTLPPLPDGEPIFVEAFDDNRHDWDEWADSDGGIAVQDGELQIRVLLSDWFFWTNPNVELSDIDLSFEGRAIEGDEANISYGVICRYIDTENFYLFTVSADGFYSVGAYVSNEYVEIVSWEESPAIVTGLAVNRVRTVCSGTTLELYVNDELLVSTQDATHTGGTIGLHAGTFDVGSDPVAVSFDNLVVYAPAP